MRTSFIAAFLFSGLIQLAGQAVSTSRVIGEVASADAAKKELVVKADGGALTTIQIAETTRLLRVAPGEKDLAKASPIQFSDIGAGDRVLVRGQAPAASVIVMTKTDIAKKHDADRAEWLKRGMAGFVTAVNRDAKEITISARVEQARRAVVVEIAEGARFRRYAPDSVRFSDAKPSSFDEVQTGDQMRVLGDSDAGQTRIKASEIVFGTFLTLAGTITSVDAASSEVTIKNLETKKPVTVRVNSQTTLKKLPTALANILAARLRGEQPGTAPGGGDRRPPAGTAQMTNGGAPVPGARPGRPRGSMEFSDMLERMPVFALGELKAGDAIILSSTKGTDPTKVTAIAVVAGVEPLLTAAPQQIGGAWNFDIGMPTM